MLPFVMAVNVELFDSQGLDVPRTWEELVAIGAVLKEQGVYALTVPGGVNRVYQGTGSRLDST